MADENREAKSRQAVDAVYRASSRRVFATLVRLLGDFDVAEEAVQDAFAAAVDQWARDGVPANPVAWLVSTGRFKGIDAIRRNARFDASLGELAQRIGAESYHPETADGEGIDDDQLRLIFTCCHPAFSPEARVALTLREVCGLTTEEIGRAFLSSPATVAQRIVRAKAKIKAANIPYQVPSRADLPQRLDAVLAVVYLVFNEGYSASSGDLVTRPDLSAEAIRLGRLITELLPEAEVVGLLALMLLQDSRSPARISESGEIVLLEEQDRTLWDQDKIAEGLELTRRALASGRVGAFTLQAAIAALHAEARSAAQTDWGQIAALYTLLMQVDASPVVELNRAVAVAMRDGPAAGLDLIEKILARGELADYHLAHAARAELCRRMGRNAEAAKAYDKAIALAKQEPERRFLLKRRTDLGV